jgi:hypothetical protein
MSHDGDLHRVHQARLGEAAEEVSIMTKILEVQ